MRKRPLFEIESSALVGALALVASAAIRAEVVESRTLEESVAIDDLALLVVEVENVFGSVSVTGYDGTSVEMKAVETIRADTAFDLERARGEVRLETSRVAGLVAFRVRWGEECECEHRRWDDYVVEYDIDLRVPRAASLDISTVNGGDVRVAGVHGNFDVSNVNGGVSLLGLHGTGRAQTVNGRLDASFERPPEGETSFKTVNGAIEVAFPSDLSADLQFKTMHGEVWTDFDVEPLPLEPVRSERRDGARWVIRSERSSAVRVGTGGPTHSFETLNGEIRIVEVQR